MIYDTSIFHLVLWWTLFFHVICPDYSTNLMLLSFRFEGITKNFKLYYDGQHYVGEKRFDTVQDLVADGLITFYLEAKAADYIAALSNESNYAESPYVAYNTQKRLQMAATKNKPNKRASTGSAAPPRPEQPPPRSKKAQGDRHRSRASVPVPPVSGSGSGGSGSGGSIPEVQNGSASLSPPSTNERPPAPSPVSPPPVPSRDIEPPTAAAAPPLPTSVPNVTNQSGAAASAGASSGSQIAAGPHSPPVSGPAGSTPAVQPPTGSLRNRVNLPVEGRLSQLLESRKSSQDAVAPAAPTVPEENNSNVDGRVSHSTNTDGPVSRLYIISMA